MAKYLKVSSLGRTLISANEIEDNSYGLVESACKPD
jgi:hypothetical protein